MLGLAKMALRLAARRMGYSGPEALMTWNSGESPIERHLLAKSFPGVFRGTREYYAICDRITRGEQP